MHEIDTILLGIQQLLDLHVWLNKMRTEAQSWVQVLIPLKDSPGPEAHLPGGVYALNRLASTIDHEQAYAIGMLVKRGLNHFKADTAGRKAFLDRVLGMLKADCQCDNCRSRRELTENLLGGGRG